ncbi:protein EARLY-RESPONSIVE TO DEHYDRATION 7, chloroplastic-like [Zingiber officinale]|uniref:Senescence domain-containing protein n=1 Tax=Zingiber officinale TaxID=94328 RepID=A0A8J5LTK4_ZINOF|nr:protein EARLY-RESPONSIVE TO DEHYDRATION 7, chloroplastic-like [Zingiber officinale]KAG6529713.1 hypothetical protein ZIOFF_011926 [Zingiber officinale]
MDSPHHYSPPPPSAPPLPSTSSSYPSIDFSDLPDEVDSPRHSSSKATLLRVPGAFLHLVDKHLSVELASGELSIVSLRQSDSFVAVLVRVGGSDDPDAVQWPLTRDSAAVKLDESHYFFSLRVPGGDVGHSPDVFSYGLTFASKGQEDLLRDFDRILETYGSFSVQKVKGAAEAVDGSVAGEVTPAEAMQEAAMKEMMEERSAAYWTTLAPNVEDYSGLVAKAIAAGSGQVVRGILWCGDVTVERLKWGNDLLKERMEPNTNAQEITPETLERIKRVKKFTKMSEKVATGVLSGVVKVSGYVTCTVANSRAGKKFFDMLPGEVVLASLDGFGKICDAFEVAGKSVLSTSSVVTTGLVSHKYGEQAAEAATEGLDAAGHAVGAAWTVFKIRKAVDPKSSIKPHIITKTAVKAMADDLRAKHDK